MQKIQHRNLRDRDWACIRKEGLCLIHEDEKIQREAVERLKRFVDLAARIDETCLLIGASERRYQDMEEYDRWEAVLARESRGRRQITQRKGSNADAGGHQSTGMRTKLHE